MKPGEALIRAAKAQAEGEVAVHRAITIYIYTYGLTENFKRFSAKLV